jgi:hypothetical protein
VRDPGSEANEVWTCTGHHAVGAPFITHLVPAFASPPGVTSVDPQPHAVLQFEDQVGPANIEIKHVVWISASFEGIPLDFDSDTL